MSDPVARPEDDDQIRSTAIAWVVALEGRPSLRKKRQFDQWLATDPRHAAAYRRVAGRFDGARVLRGSRLHAARPAPARRRLGGAIMAGAATVMAATLIAILQPDGMVWGGRDPLSATPQTVRASGLQRRLSAPPSGIKSFGLADGSIVTLDGSSTLDVEYTDNKRLLILRRGRVRFDVAHDGRPFTVLAGGGSITARGTVFDVSQKRTGSVDVALLRGIVDVAAIARSSPPADVRSFRRLRAGEGVTFGRGAFGLPQRPAQTTSGRWVSGDVEFDNVSLDYVVGATNQGAGPRIRLDDPALGRLRVSGRFDLGNSSRLATNLARLFDLTLDGRADGIHLVRRQILSSHALLT